MHSSCFSDSSWVQADPVVRVTERVHVHFAKWESGAQSCETQEILRTGVLISRLL